MKSTKTPWVSHSIPLVVNYNVQTDFENTIKLATFAESPKFNLISRYNQLPIVNIFTFLVFLINASNFFHVKSRSSGWIVISFTTLIIDVKEWNSIILSKYYHGGGDRLDVRLSELSISNCARCRELELANVSGRPCENKAFAIVQECN